MKSDPIQDFILENEKNLNIAATVSEAWPEVMAKIAFEFQNRLGTQLVARFKGWTFEADKRFFIDNYAKFYFFKPEWNFHSIALEGSSYGKEMVYGVFRDLTARKAPRYPELLEIVKEIEPSAKSSEWYDAWVKMRYPAYNWQKPDVLWLMHSDKDFLNEVSGQLLNIAKICEPIIDRLVREK
jgi:hypothetical protein